MYDIHLYLGAHKTATTHLQGTLLANRNTLSSRKITLSAPQDLRKTWLPEFFKYCKSSDKGVESGQLEKLQSVSPRHGLWILTEENILGVSNDLKERSGIYPATADRLKGLAELFGREANLSLFFSLRSYDTFYRSAYSEIVRNRGYLPFDEFYDESRFENNSWIETVEMFQSVLPQANITLWKFEDFRELLPRLVRLLTGIEEVNELLDAYQPERTRPSLSQKTIEVLKVLSPVLSREESLNLVERINHVYSQANGYSSYTPFNEQQEASFRDRYEIDIQTIKDSFPDIRFLHP
jgi:hypothetical protein